MQRAVDGILIAAVVYREKQNEQDTRGYQEEMSAVLYAIQSHKKYQNPRQ
jgi:hypothetical protein